MHPTDVEPHNRERCISELKHDLQKKEQFKEDLKTVIPQICGLRVDLMNCYMKFRSTVTWIDEIWWDSKERNKLFKEYRNHFIEYKKYYGYDEIKVVFDFYQMYLDFEINIKIGAMDDTEFDIKTNRIPGKVLNSNDYKIINSYITEFRQCISDNRNKYDENFNELLDKHLLTLDTYEFPLEEILTYILYEQESYESAIKSFNSLANQTNKDDFLALSKIHRKKGVCYCGLEKYDLALKEFESAISVIENPGKSEGWIERLKKEINEIVSILEQ